MSDKLTRIALIKEDKCKPKKCRQECKRSCPVVRLGKECIEVSPNSKLAFISEELCIGCGICVKKCPFEAINIINLPKSLDSCQTHRYGPNSFKLHRLPMPRPGQVLGLVGTNGIGKSTALKILAGKQKPNLGRFDSPPDWAEILVNFRGSELQVYFFPRHLSGKDLFDPEFLQRYEAVKYRHLNDIPTHILDFRTTSQRSWRTIWKPSSSRNTLITFLRWEFCRNILSKHSWNMLFWVGSRHSNCVVRKFLSAVLMNRNPSKYRTYCVVCPTHGLISLYNDISTRRNSFWKILLLFLHSLQPPYLQQPNVLPQTRPSFLYFPMSWLIIMFLPFFAGCKRESRSDYGG